jgi:hypothetical protein
VAAQAGEASAAGPGLLVDGRYRLDQVRAEHRPRSDIHTVLWRAADTALDRPVAILVITGLDAQRHKSVAETAARASQVSDARFVRVLDVGRLDPPSGAKRGARPTWIATEWVEAPSLAASVRGEPLHPAVATEIARQCAEALEAAERIGCPHGRLHPGQVLLPAGGIPRITGLGLAAVLDGEQPTDDVRALGGLLFAALTGRWPLPGWSELPAVDARASSATRPRLVRAGISRDLDETTHRMLTGGYADAHACARALSLLPVRPLDRPAEPVADPGPSAWRRWAWRIVPPAVVAAIGLTGWALGSELGRVPSTARQHQAALPPAQASAPGTGKARLVWRHAPAATGFDPEGDGQENDDEAGLAVDRDRTTAWTTDLYHGNSHLGGLKSGVGLLLDLGKPTSVQVAELALTTPGADVEIRAGDQAPSTAAGLPLIARRDGAPQRTKFAFDAPQRARYWLIWFTNLPPDSGGFRVGVAEVALLG